jgi:acyl carrier protein
VPQGASPREKDGQLTDLSAASLATLLRDLLQDVLGLSQERADTLQDDSGLFGELPEFDSMAVATVLTELEDRFGIQIDDDEVDGEIFESFGNLHDFVERKQAS